MDWSKHLKVQQAASAMMTGGVIAYPTESVWGLGCDPNNAHAVKRILTIKKRPAEKGLILVAANIEQFSPYLVDLSDSQLAQLQQTWPGPVTWLIPDIHHRVPHYIKGDFETVALRVSSHPIIQALCTVFGGPIVSTSANPAGLLPAKSAMGVNRYFYSRIDYIAPGNTLNLPKPTEIRDLLTGAVHRAG
ncbi:MAG: L-threonylcarbamoyladenylate synthase [Cellvibrionaceae bacterium]